MTLHDTTRTPNFIRTMIEDDLKTNKYGGRVHTRFPPEPNGYLHIGHAKSICLNFGLARDYRGLCNLRFDDTNPSKEEKEYVESIKEDIRWLGFNWDDREFYASDYFGQLYEYALLLIKKAKAYVDDLSADDIRKYRGTLTRPGKESPYRNRSVEENLDLFKRMRRGEFKDGSRVLRAKIDMAAPNLNMRDPVMYRILHAHHHRSGDRWCIYPTYDFAHGQSDSIEGITHSICTLEFEDHRPLYDWFIEELGIYHSQQIEFARLNLSYTVMSKRMLLELVEDGYVTGWDDPRMPTISGLRRRGYTPESIRDFCERIGVAKKESMVDISLLEHCLREDLNKRAPRVMAVLHPLKVVLTNYPEDKVEELEAINNPENPGAGARTVPFSRVLYIEQDDFREDPPQRFYRLAPGREVRLRYAYFITCVEVIKDKTTGEIVELHCTYDPKTRGGDSPDGRRVMATLHWVSAAHSLQAEIRLYDHFFTAQNPTEEKEGLDFKAYLKPKSLETLTNCRVEPSLKDATPGSRYQFERLGYFCVDAGDSSRETLVFNRTATLRDTWAKIQKAGEGSSKKIPEKENGRDAMPFGTQAIEPIGEEITIEEFSKIDLRVGIIREASPLEGAKKLVRLMVDIGEGRLRQIFAGISSAYPDPENLIGKKVIVVANLKPRKMSFGISEGMVLSGGDLDRLCITTFDGNPLPGDKVS
jgi:glutaminyl-tRNA synthetase